MSEELQSLLDRIEKDGVDKANAKADEIVKNAEAKAAELIKDAEAKAAAHMTKAEEDSKAFEVRSSKALDQAARDVILSVERSVAAIFARIAAEEVAKALDTDTIRGCVASLIESYTKADAEGSRLAITLSEEQRADVVSYLSQKFQTQLADGVSIEGSDTIGAGFKVAVTDKEVEHDFTGKAVAEALGALLRTDLATIVKGAAAS
jgi:V/A-type H+-transporting ATPase subunit E